MLEYCFIKNIPVFFAEKKKTWESRLEKEVYSVIAMVISPARSRVIKSLRNVTIHNNQQYHSLNYTIGYSVT